MFLRPVPALEASIPRSTNTANIAEISSKGTSVDFAIAPTLAIAVSNFIKSKADDENDLAMTSVTRPISFASRPNALNTCADTLADSARS